MGKPGSEPNAQSQLPRGGGPGADGPTARALLQVRGPGMWSGDCRSHNYRDPEGIAELTASSASLRLHTPSPGTPLAQTLLGQLPPLQ